MHPPPPKHTSTPHPIFLSLNKDKKENFILYLSFFIHTNRKSFNKWQYGHHYYLRLINLPTILFFFFFLLFKVILFLTRLRNKHFWKIIPDSTGFIKKKWKQIYHFSSPQLKIIPISSFFFFFFSLQIGNSF